MPDESLADAFDAFTAAERDDTASLGTYYMLKAIFYVLVAIYHKLPSTDALSR